MNPKNSAVMKSLLNKYKTFLFDCDGVLWKSTNKIEENFWILEELQKHQKQVFFISNNCMRSREEIQQRFFQFGYQAKMDQIYLSSSILANHINYEYPDVKNVYAIGASGLMEELRKVNLSVIDGNIHNDKILDHQYVREYIKNEIGDVDAVVVGFDNKFNFYKMCFAANCLQLNPNCKFFATEKTKKMQFQQNLVLPSVGSIYKGIQECANVGEPIVVSKPHTSILEILHKKYNLEKKSMVMIGDKLDTDIEMANKYNIDSLLLFTGETRIEEKQNLNDFLQAEPFWNRYIKNNQLYMFDNFANPGFQFQM